jgi:hypothetical protein
MVIAGTSKALAICTGEESQEITSFALEITAISSLKEVLPTKFMAYASKTLALSISFPVPTTTTFFPIALANSNQFFISHSFSEKLEKGDNTTYSSGREFFHHIFNLFLFHKKFG